MALPSDTPVSDALMRKMMGINVGEAVTDELNPLLVDQMGVEKSLPRRQYYEPLLRWRKHGA